MSEMKEKLAKFKAEAESQLAAAGEKDIDDELLSKLVNNLKLVIDNKDALSVAGSDPKEMETVRRNFIVKKLGVDDEDKGKEICTDVAKRMSDSRMKNRAAFYYLCQKAAA